MERVAGLGVRAKTILKDDASEFVIRESSNGNETLSLIHVDDLMQVVTSKRDDLGNVTIEKHMITKNVETFSHYRYDWLDNYKILWWIMAGLGLLIVLSSSFLSALFFLMNPGVLLFFAGLFLTIMQIADPEYIVFETSSGAHRFLVYRMGSNRLLTNVSMDLIDDTMQEYLKSGKLDTSEFDNRSLFSMSSPSAPISQPPITVPTSPPPTEAPPSLPPTEAPPSLPPTEAPASPPPMAPPSISTPMGPPLGSPPSMSLPTTVPAPMGPPPMSPPSISAPMGPPSMAPPPPESDFSEIPAPPPVDFSDIPPPPQVRDLESVSEEDKNQLLDELK